MGRIYGDEFDNDLSGTAHRDKLYGLLGNDTLTGGTPHDWLFGGEGNDSLISHAQYVVMLGGAGNDNLQVWGEASGYGGDGDDVFTGYGSMYGGKGGDLFTVGWTRWIDGGAGSDTIIGNGEGYSAYGGGGADLISGEKNVYVENKTIEDALDRLLPAKLAPPRSPEGTLVILIVDKSSSMEGKKMELARLASIESNAPARTIASIARRFTTRLSTLRQKSNRLWNTPSDFRVRRIASIAERPVPRMPPRPYRIVFASIGVKR